jgi:GT2 family glycosyltransferase
MRPQVTAVVLAYGDEPVLGECVQAILASTDVDVDVVLVDNGCTTDAVERQRETAGVTVVSPGTNTGFAGGCNLGARHAHGAVLAFVNGDAVVRPDALGALVAALDDDAVGLASASLRLYEQPELMNSAGNPMHFSGLSWAGGLGEPATAYAVARDVPLATGAATAVRADRFAELGGFAEEMFAYCEDAELSLRTWQHGWRVRYVPDAVVLHRYEFSRNPTKNFLLERNRLFLVGTLYERRTLAVLMPVLLALEVAVSLVALRQGWFRQKSAGWWWLWRHRDVVAARRRWVQASRRVPDRDLVGLLTGDFAPGDSTGLVAPPPLRAASRGYWAVARRLLAGGRLPRVPADHPATMEPAAAMTDDTTSKAYAQRLERLEGARWKRILDVQRPYRWNLGRLDLGRTLDVGCGIGRNLVSLPAGRLGVDHNATSVQTARERGLDAITSAEFDERYPEHPPVAEFDSILLAHVLEHMTRDEGLWLLRHYLPHGASKVAVICPQEKGYTTDATHVTFLDGADIAGMLEEVGLRVLRVASFPFPRAVGKVFAYNETVVVAERPRT